MNQPAPPLVPVLAALPVALCMAILGLPAALGNGPALAFRTMYLVACMAWTVPLALLQRALWRREASWLVTGLALLGASYGMSLLNNLFGQFLGIALGLARHIDWRDLVYGLDGCWLALAMFCAVHALAVYYLSLQRTRLHLAQAQAAARDAELRALRLQVNPHFLFNTLNAISALVAAGAAQDANRMIGRVSDFLRATLAHDGRHEHALAEELALTEAYLDIEKARLGPRLQLSMKAGPDLLDAAVPYLMLQPLVENAVRHGIAPLAAPGRLDIVVGRAGGSLLVEVCNDGRPGAAARSDAAAVADRAANAPGGIDQAGTTQGGIGLANVAERLRRLYGEAQQVDAGWRADGRFGVRIALPLRPLPPPSPAVAANDAGVAP